MDLISLNKIKVVGFLTAIQENDKNHLDVQVTDKQFETLCEEYMTASKQKASNLEVRVEKMQAKALLLHSCLTVLTRYPGEEEIVEILNDAGYKISRDTYFKDIERLKKDLSNLMFKYKNEKSRLPKKKVSEKTKTSIYDMLTALSSGLELSLNFETMTVGEFISWRKQLKSKTDSLKKTNKNGKR